MSALERPVDPREWLYWACPRCGIERTKFPNDDSPKCLNCGNADEPLPASEF